MISSFYLYLDVWLDSLVADDAVPVRGHGQVVQPLLEPVLLAVDEHLAVELEHGARRHPAREVHRHVAVLLAASGKEKNGWKRSKIGLFPFIILTEL